MEDYDGNIDEIRSRKCIQPHRRKNQKCYEESNRPGHEWTTAGHDVWNESIPLSSASINRLGLCCCGSARIPHANDWRFLPAKHPLDGLRNSTNRVFLVRT